MDVMDWEPTYTPRSRLKRSLDDLNDALPREEPAKRARVIIKATKSAIKGTPRSALQLAYYTLRHGPHSSYKFVKGMPYAARTVSKGYHKLPNMVLGVVGKPRPDDNISIDLDIPGSYPQSPVKFQNHHQAEIGPVMETQAQVMAQVNLTPSPPSPPSQPSPPPQSSQPPQPLQSSQSSPPSPPSPPSPQIIPDLPVEETMKQLEIDDSIIDTTSAEYQSTNGYMKHILTQMKEHPEEHIHVPRGLLYKDEPTKDDSWTHLCNKKHGKWTRTRELGELRIQTADGMPLSMEETVAIGKNEADTRARRRAIQERYRGVDIDDDDDNYMSLLRRTKEWKLDPAAKAYLRRKEAERLEAKRLREEAARKKEEAAARQRREAERVREQARRASLRVVRPVSKDWNAMIDSKLKLNMRATVGKGITRKDLGSLLPQHQDDGIGWLNDEVINTYSAYIMKEVRGKVGQAATGQERPKFHAFSSYMYANYRDSKRPPKNIKQFERWNKRAKLEGKNLLHAEKVFIPINDRSHWTLLIISGTEKTITYYDSMSGKGLDYMEFALEYVKMTLGNDFKAEEWTVEAKSCSQQTNGIDCGAFVCLNTLALAKGVDPEDAFDDRHISNARRLIAATLINDGFGGDIPF